MTRNVDEPPEPDEPPDQLDKENENEDGHLTSAKSSDCRDLVPESLAPIAFKAALKILHNWQDAEGITQGTLAAFLVAGGPDNPEAWVTRVAQNLARNEVRRRAKCAQLSDRIAHESQEHSEEFTDRVVGRLLVEDVLKFLSPKQRKAIELQFLLDLSRMTVAEVMKIGPESVKTHVTRGKKTARDRYEELAGEGGKDPDVA